MIWDQDFQYKMGKQKRLFLTTIVYYQNRLQFILVHQAISFDLHPRPTIKTLATTVAIQSKDLEWLQR